MTSTSRKTSRERETSRDVSTYPKVLQYDAKTINDGLKHFLVKFPNLLSKYPMWTIWKELNNESFPISIDAVSVVEDKSKSVKQKQSLEQIKKKQYRLGQPVFNTTSLIKDDIVFSLKRKLSLQSFYDEIYDSISSFLPDKKVSGIEILDHIILSATKPMTLARFNQSINCHMAIYSRAKEEGKAPLAKKPLPISRQSNSPQKSKTSLNKESSSKKRAASSSSSEEEEKKGKEETSVEVYKPVKKHKTELVPRNNKQPTAEEIAQHLYEKIKLNPFQKTDDTMMELEPYLNTIIKSGISPTVIKKTVEDKSAVAFFHMRNILLSQQYLRSNNLLPSTAAEKSNTDVSFPQDIVTILQMASTAEEKLNIVIPVSGPQDVVDAVIVPHMASAEAQKPVPDVSVPQDVVEKDTVSTSSRSPELSIVDSVETILNATPQNLDDTQASTNLMEITSTMETVDINLNQSGETVDINLNQIGETVDIMTTQIEPQASVIEPANEEKAEESSSSSSEEEEGI